jgi:hypothetical protein
MTPGVVYPPVSTERTPMCACADNDANWRGHGLSARLVCICGGTTVSAKGLAWAPRRPADPPTKDSEAPRG